MKRDLYAEVSARIVAELEAGTAPWIKPWSATAGANTPCNAVANRPYSGCNVVLLWMTRTAGPIRDIQVLCSMNRGGAGARSLNIELQAALNPAGDRKVERFGWRFAPGDKVMQIESDYEKEVYNGDIGTIDDVDSNSGELIASFDGRSVTYGFGELDMLVPAYAATIHKSQGSEYPAVIIPVLTQHYAMLQRNLLYTGVTRGKQLVVLVGQKKAVAIAVRNISGRRRWSKLGEWLRPRRPLVSHSGSSKERDFD